MLTRGRGPFPVVIGFALKRGEIEKLFKQARAALAPAGVLWLAYPKKGSKTRTDITRDEGWEVLAERGWLPVSIVAVDETWSALRFKHDPALKTLRQARRLKRSSESPTIDIRRSDITTQTTPRKRRREQPTINLRRSGKAKPLTSRSTRRMKAVVRTPADLAEALAVVPAAKKRWGRLLPEQKREHVSFLDEVKRADARAGRIAKLVDELS